MTVNEAELHAVVSGVAEPDLGRSLGELGMVRSVSARRRGVEVTLAVPVAGWPVLDELVTRVRRAPGAPGPSP